METMLSLLKSELANVKKKVEKYWGNSIRLNNSDQIQGRVL